MQIHAISGVPYPLSTERGNLFSSSISARGRLSRQKLGCSLHAAPPPPPRTPQPALGGKFSSLTAAVRGALRRHGWTHTPERGALLTVPAMPHAKSSLAAPRSQSPGQAPRQRKTRASPSRENAVISRCFVLPTPPPSPRGARFGGVWFSSESTSATVSVIWGTSGLGWMDSAAEVSL